MQFTPDLMPGDVTGSLVYDAEDRRASSSARDRSSPTSCSPTRSTARPRRRSRRCSRRWRSARSRVDGVTPPAARPVPRRRDAEPDRVRGHLHAARGAARPLPAQARARPAGARRPRSRCSRGTRPASTRATSPPPASRPVLDAGELAAAQRAVASVGASAPTCSPTSSTSPGRRGGARRCKLGVSPRGTTALLAAAKAWAWLSRLRLDHARPRAGDARCPCWRHRIQLRPEAELEGVAVDAILRSILQQVQVPI